MTGMRLALLTAGMLAAIVAPPPSAASAQQDTARQDSTRRGAASTGSKPVQIEAGRLNHTMRSESLPHRTASKGTMGMGLSRAQLRELQQSLANAGCDPGPVDGVAGPRTHVAMRCAAGKKGLPAGAGGTNINDLLRALGLGFTASDSTMTAHGARARRGATSARSASDTGATGSAGAAGTTGTGTGAGTTRASATGGMERTMSSSDTGRSQTARHRRPPGVDSARRGRTGAARDSQQMGKPPND